MNAIKLFFHIMVVWYLFEVAHASTRSMIHCSTENLNQLSKTPVKSIKSPDGDIIDCVHICHQPAFNHPSLKNYTIMMRPTNNPTWMNDNDIKVPKNATKVGKKGLSQLWHSSGNCPKGTIPIRRTMKDDLKLLESYHKKKRDFVGQRSSNDSIFNTSKYATYGHEHAIANTNVGQFYGAKATFNVWNPHIQDISEFSLAQLWILAGPDSSINTIEAGWQVFPGMYGDTNTKLFIYHTNDGYQRTTCYNLDCGVNSFIQTNNEIAIAGSISHTSQIDGTQYEMTISISKDQSQGVWWMTVNDEPVGYWPQTLFTYLSESAERSQFGGEIINSMIGGYHTRTEMGSGQFAEAGYGKAGYIKNIQLFDENMNLRTPYLSTMAAYKYCYDVILGNNDNSGASLFYGGPGQNQQCV